MEKSQAVDVIWPIWIMWCELFHQNFGSNSVRSRFQHVSSDCTFVRLINKRIYYPSSPQLRPQFYRDCVHKSFSAAIICFVNLYVVCNIKQNIHIHCCLSVHTITQYNFFFLQSQPFVARCTHTYRKQHTGEAQIVPTAPSSGLPQNVNVKNLPSRA